MPNEPQESPPRRISTSYTVLLATLTWVFVGWLGWLFFQFAALHPLIAIGILVLVVAAGSWRYILDEREKWTKEAELRKRRAEVYEQFLAIWLDIARSKKAEECPRLPTDEQMERLFQLHPLILLWASDGVIQQYLRFREMVNLSEKVSALQTLPLLENLVIAMRRDLGQDAITGRCGDLLRQFAEDAR